MSWLSRAQQLATIGQARTVVTLTERAKKVIKCDERSERECESVSEGGGEGRGGIQGF